MKNRAVYKTMREKAEVAELQNCPNGIFRLVKGLKTDSKHVEGGREEVMKGCVSLRRKR